MIKNIIFDMGGVLVNYTPKAYLKSLGYDDGQTEKLHELIFNAPLWLELDRGTYSNKSAIGAYQEKYPELQKEIETVFTGSFDTMLSVKEDSAEFLKELKREGYNIYVLSNFSTDGYAYIEPRFDYLNYVDEKVISAHVNMIKPEKELYDYMIKKLNIVPEESIFIDDLQENLEPAEALGIHPVLFTTLDEVKTKVRALLNAC